MTTTRKALPVWVGAWAAVLALAALGCEKLPTPLRGNLLPEVRLTAAPIDTSGRYFYSYTLDWVGFDPDGRIDHYLYAIDPAPGDTAWQVTHENERLLTFKASRPDSLTDPTRYSADFHVFVIKAVDNAQAAGPSVNRAFFSYTQAPTVHIDAPRPNHFLIDVVAPSLRISWSGTDNDGILTNKPVRYRYILMSSATPFPGGLDAAEGDPSSLVRYYAPAFAESLGWVETPAETTTVLLSNLTPFQRYLFVVVAFDEAGAFSPVFTLDNNMLRFRVGYAGIRGPKITIFNEFFEYTQKQGSYTTSPSAEVFVEFPAGTGIRFNWFATPAAEGIEISDYRWMMDGDVTDETQRFDEHTDFKHWSARSLNTTSATVGPFRGGEDHRFYVEAEDNVGLRSLVTVHFQTVQSSLAKSLLIVDDTRYRVDLKGVDNRYIKPKGNWPTAAEIDTFLYAVGGVPWEGDYPQGSLSRVGLFTSLGLRLGVDYDTLGTRLGRAILTIPLSSIGEYAHVLWLVDQAGSLNNEDGTNVANSMTSLRYMCSAGRVNTLAAYLRQGGQVWVAGGGGAMSSTLPWNDGANDGGGILFSSLNPNPAKVELRPGRFMFDVVKWQSEIREAKAFASITRFTGRYGNASPYAGLPRAMETKEASDADPQDAIYPFRAASEYYIGNVELEYLSQPNYVIEAVTSEPDPLVEASVLDTLYEASSISLPRPDENAHNVVMTYAANPLWTGGQALPPFIFTGFNLWNFKRAECMALVDFVLNHFWTGITRSGPPPARLRAAVSAPRAAPRAHAGGEPLAPARPRGDLAAPGRR